LDGELYQDLATEPGAVYAVELSVQRYDPRQVWHPHSLAVSWDNQLLAHFDFVESDDRWIRPQFFVKATGSMTRLRFLGSGYPSFDNISVTRLAGASYSGAMAVPPEGFRSLEGDPIPLRSLWTSVGGASIPSTTTFLLGGLVPLATATPTGGEANAVWTNPPPGVHFISGSGPGGYQTTPVRVVVGTRPKLQPVTPFNRQVFAPGAPVGLRVDLIDNTGTNAIRAVRILVAGQPFAHVAPSGGRIESTWTAGSEGSYLVEFIGQTDDERDVARTSVLIQVLPTGERDVIQAAEGGVESLSTADRIAQTFTAGFDGRLVAVDLVGGSSSGRLDNALRLEILDVDPVTRKPGTNVLGSTQRTLQEAMNPASESRFHFAFPSNQIQLIRGQSYALAFRHIAPEGERTFLRSSFSDAMRGGQIWRQSGADWIPAPRIDGAIVGHDLQMTTWMVPVPRPSASVQSPTPLAAFAAGEAIPIRIEATPGTPSNRLERVTFFGNGLELGSLTSPPFEFPWTNPPVGNHVLQASATDENGRTAWSEPVSVLSGLDATLLPRLHIADTVSPEGNSSFPPLVFPVSLSAPAASPVTVQFNTRNLDAIAGEDYLEDSGTLTFAPGQTQAFVFVRLLTDTHDEQHQSLRLELRLPEGAILERPFATGTIIDDEPGPGKASVYEWSALPALAHPGTPFNVQLTARDPQGTNVASIPGGIRIGIIRETDSPRLFLGPSDPDGTTQEYGFTAGLRFRPKVDIIATHLRTRGGRYAALRSDQGHVHADARFTVTFAQWQEAALERPVLLKAGTVYYLTLYMSVRGMPTGAAGLAGLEWIEHWGQTLIYGDGFPTQPGLLSPAVDFRFIPVEFRPDLLPTFSAMQFPDGTWEGPVTVTTAGPRLRLAALDRLGNTAISARLPFAPPEMWLAPDPSAPGPSYLLHVPDGYRFLVQASPDLNTWTDSSPAVLSSGSPVSWLPAGPLSPAAFFRLITVD
jgi:hypothetical protein